MDVVILVMAVHVVWEIIVSRVLKLKKYLRARDAVVVWWMDIVILVMAVQIVWEIIVSRVLIIKLKKYLRARDAETSRGPFILV
jgi:hypothetical protein